MEKKKSRKIDRALRDNHISYWSDLFIVTMVLGWAVTVVCMIIFAVYSTIVYADNSIWCELGTLVAVPLSCGGAIWMIKNSVQHAIANKDGREAAPDFPAVDDSMEISGREERMKFDSEPEEAEEEEPEAEEAEAETEEEGACG